MNIDQLKKLLPLQNPLYSFLHNNSLQAFEDDFFFDGILKAAHLYQARTLPPGIEYRQWYKAGVIKSNYLKQAIDHYCQTIADPPVNSEDLYLIMTKPIKYIIEEWHSPLKSWVHFWENEHQQPFRETIHHWFIPWIQSYLDQGLSLFANPYTHQGLFSYFNDSINSCPNYLRGHLNEAKNLIKETANTKPQERLSLLLEKTGYPKEQYESLLLEVCFYIKGWSGMANRLASDSEQRLVANFELNMEDWCSVLLILHLSLHRYYLKLNSLENRSLYACSFKFSDLKFSQGARIIQECQRENILIKDPTLFLDWFEGFNNQSRYQIWQEALENSFIEKSHQLIRSGIQNARQNDKSQIQALYLFCIDDREESIRRHLENQSPQIATAGVVGFFGLNMKFKSLTHPKATVQCPPVVNPEFNAEEVTPANSITSSWIKIYSLFRTGLFRATRTLTRGWIATILLGPFSFLIMSLRILKPIWFKNLFNIMTNIFLPRAITQLKSDFDLNSKADRVKMIANMGGLNSSSDFPKYIFVVAHQSNASNNPYRQAYGCGACSGNSGAPNSRLFAEFANDQEVRSYLKSKNFEIPDHTLFIPLLHDTCSDEISILDSSHLTNSNADDILNYINYLKTAAQYNAQERLEKLKPEKKFNPQSAFNEVINRSMDLAQPRPEYGHAGVYFAVFGPRSWTQSLNLNRQSFLISYDSQKDHDASLLKELLIGALPVCANIGLDYFFSRSDTEGLGSGTKLPLNITGLYGVMTGTFSDLRIGLAQQMTDIHIPLRMNIYIDSTPEILTALFNSHPRLKKLVFNQWVHIFYVNQSTLEVSRFLCS